MRLAVAVAALPLLLASSPLSASAFMPQRSSSPSLGKNSMRTVVTMEKNKIDYAPGEPRGDYSWWDKSQTTANGREAPAETELETLPEAAYEAEPMEAVEAEAVLVAAAESEASASEGRGDYSWWGKIPSGGEGQGLYEPPTAEMEMEYEPMSVPPAEAETQTQAEMHLEGSYEVESAYEPEVVYESEEETVNGGAATINGAGESAKTDYSWWGKVPTGGEDQMLYQPLPETEAVYEPEAAYETEAEAVYEAEAAYEPEPVYEPEAEAEAVYEPEPVYETETEAVNEQVSGDYSWWGKIPTGGENQELYQPPPVQTEAEPMMEYQPEPEPQSEPEATMEWQAQPEPEVEVEAATEWQMETEAQPVEPMATAAEEVKQEYSWWGKKPTGGENQQLYQPPAVISEYDPQKWQPQKAAPTAEEQARADYSWWGKKPWGGTQRQQQQQQELYQPPTSPPPEPEQYQQPAIPAPAPVYYAPAVPAPVPVPAPAPAPASQANSAMQALEMAEAALAASYETDVEEALASMAAREASSTPAAPAAAPAATVATASAAAAVPPKKKGYKTINTTILGSPASPSPPDQLRRLRTRTETSRADRRDVYDFDKWVRHRKPSRWFRRLWTIPQSGLIPSLINEVTVVASVAAVVCAYNSLLVEGYTDFGGEYHDNLLRQWAGYMYDPLVLPKMVLPNVVFTLTSSSLTFLLAFRTKFSYSRWDEARKAWGLNINRSRDLVRTATAWTNPSRAVVDPIAIQDPSFASSPGGKHFYDPQRRQYALMRVSRATWAFNRSLMRHLSSPLDEEEYERQLRERLPAETADSILAATHRPNRAMQELSAAVNALPVHFLRRNEIDREVMTFEDTCGGCERLFSSPIPIFYTRWTARFLSLGMLAVPFCLYEPFKDTWNHVGAIPASAVVSLCIFGIEELAVQLEEPFSLLPMQGFCNKIGDNCDEIVKFGLENTAETASAGGKK